MGITVYSLAISIVFYNLALIAVFILRRSPGFRARHAVSLLAFITVLGVVRLVLPIDFDAAYVVRSYTIIPAIEDFLKRPLAASFTYGHLLLALWAVGSLVMVIKDVRLQRRFDRYLQSIDFVDRPELLKIAAEYGNDFAVLISPQLHMPFTSGILHPVIYLPDVELSDAEWRMVFRHEITHIRSRDNLKKLFFLAVEALFWWNPLAHFSSAEINTLIELYCDAKVTVGMSAQEKLEYIALLKKLLDLSFPKRAATIATNLIGGMAEMQQRFSAIGNTAKSSKSSLVMMYFVASLLFVLSYFMVIQPARFPTLDLVVPQEENRTDAFCVINNPSGTMNQYIEYKNGKYMLFIDGESFCTLTEDAMSLPEYSNIQIN